MDDDFSQLEAELKMLRPAAPSVQLSTRIDAALATVAVSEPARKVRRTSRVWWLWAAALPAAAAVALVAVVWARRVPMGTTGARGAGTTLAAAQTAAATELFKPVAAENVLYAVSDEGLVTLDDGTAARRERFQYVDTITWKNPRTNASVRWTMPREEVRVVPVKFQ